MGDGIMGSTDGAVMRGVAAGDEAADALGRDVLGEAAADNRPGLRETIQQTMGASSEAVADIFAGGFSAEALLVLLAKRMDHLNHQIGVRTKSLMNKQEKAKEILGKLQVLEAVQRTINDKGGNKVKLEADKDKHMVDWDGEVVSAQSLLDEYKISLDLKSHEGKKVKNQEIDGLIEQYNHELKELNQGNELQMMELQNLTQQRSEGVSLVSNMLKKLGDANDRVIGNI